MPERCLERSDSPDAQTALGYTGARSGNSKHPAQFLEEPALVDGVLTDLGTEPRILDVIVIRTIGIVM